MAEFDGSNNSSRDSIDDEVALMSRKFKKMMKKKGKFQHSSKKRTQDSRRNIRRRAMRSSALNVKNQDI